MEGTAPGSPVKPGRQYLVCKVCKRRYVAFWTGKGGVRRSGWPRIAEHYMTEHPDEAKELGQAVQRFQEDHPEIEEYVYDDNSELQADFTAFR